MKLAQYTEKYKSTNLFYSN